LDALESVSASVVLWLSRIGLTNRVYTCIVLMYFCKYLKGDDAVIYFKGLREKYLRIKRKKAEAERSGAGAYSKENWHLFELLRFLDEVSRPRKTIGNILKSGNNSQMDSETNNTEDDTEEIRVEFLLDDISQDPIEANVVSPLIIGTDSSMDSDTINSTCDMQSVDLSSVRPTGTPTTSRNARLNSPIVKKGHKFEEKMSTALDNIAKSLKTPNNDYINTFCAQIEQEMLRMPSDLMEEFKDEVTELLLQKRKRMRTKRLNN
jgi:hypothetical protein